MTKQIQSVFKLDIFLNVYRTYRNTGPFIVMMYLMIVTDMRRVAIIYMVFLSGFAIGIITAHVYPPQVWL